MKSNQKKTIAVWEIFLLISLSFAISFMFGESLGARVSGQIASQASSVRGDYLVNDAGQVIGVAPTKATSVEGGFIMNDAHQVIGVAPDQVVTSATQMPATPAIAPPTPLAVVPGTAVPGTVYPANAFAAGQTVSGMGAGQTIVSGNQLLVSDAAGKLTAAQSGTYSVAGKSVVVEGGKITSGLAGTATQTAGYAGGKGTLGSLLTGNTFGGAGSIGGAVFSSLLSGAIWGAMVGGIAYFLAGMFGLNDQQAASIGMGAGFGTFAGTTTYFLAQNGVLGAGLQASGGALLGLGIGIGVGAAIIILTYKKQKKELVRFECLAWEPPRGGANCDECNNNPYMPCSEYRCKSLGAGCELINQGTEEETCFWVHKGDTSAPHIEPWADALAPNGLSYIPDRSISPPNRGFEIIDSEGDDCLPAFTNLQFGVIADEPAQCKIDVTPAATYDEMSYLFGESNIFEKEHTQKLKVPSPFSETGNESEIPEIHNDGTYTLWVRCIDPNGNGKDSALVAFRYCVDKGPDTTQPIIVSSSIESGSPVQFDVENVPIEVYVNEPAECRWSRQDKEFEFMENTMDCATESYQINSELNYACSAQLNGIENRADNWFYFRCMDYSTAPGGRNVMETSYPLLLKGTQPLIITKVGPTGEFVGSASVATVTLSAETDDGADEGVAACFFDTLPDGTFNIAMENTNSYVHNQSLDLTSGVYKYYFRCIDAGGNRAEASTNFSVVIDSILPGIIRVFRDGDKLKVITDEDAKCYYSENSCNYALADGLPMIYEDPTERTAHTVDWKEDITYYIKCEDLQGNQPRPDFCQIIAEASEL